MNIYHLKKHIYHNILMIKLVKIWELNKKKTEFYEQFENFLNNKKSRWIFYEQISRVSELTLMKVIIEPQIGKFRAWRWVK